jgi:hypothetical protein
MLLLLLSGLVRCDDPGPTGNGGPPGTDLPMRSSFVTEPPTAAPDGFENAWSGAILTSFLLGLIGLVGGVVATIYVIRPLVMTRFEADEPNKFETLGG